MGVLVSCDKLTDWLPDSKQVPWLREQVSTFIQRKGERDDERNADQEMERLTKKQRTTTVFKIKLKKML